MMADKIHDILFGVDPTHLTNYIILVMLVLFVFSVIALIGRKLPRLTAQTPTLLTSIGILGTFAGIVIGLAEFDTSDDMMNQSIQSLLGGLDTAFTSSLVGMSLAIIFKLLTALISPVGSKETNVSDDSADPVDRLIELTEQQNSELKTIKGSIGQYDNQSLMQNLIEMSDAQQEKLSSLVSSSDRERQYLKRQNELMDSLVNKLTDDDDQSIPGQIRQMREDLKSSASTRKHQGAAMLEAFESVRKSMDSVHVANMEMKESSVNCERLAESHFVLAQAHVNEFKQYAEFRRSSNESDEKRGDLLVAKISAVSESAQFQLNALESLVDSARSNEVCQLALKESTSMQGDILKQQIDAFNTYAERFDHSLAYQLEQLNHQRTQVNIQAEMRDAGQSLAKGQHQLNSRIDELGVRGEAANDRKIESLNEMISLLSRSPTEEIIDALKGTIREFNEKIGEQFGDNFKQLNEAVGQLLEWQENYREQLSAMREQYDQGVRSIEHSEKSMSSIASSSGVIPGYMESLGHILVTNKEHLFKLNEQLETFAAVRDKAIDAVPEIGKLVEQTVANLSDAGYALSAGIQDGTESLVSSFSQVSALHGESTRRMMASAESITQRTSDESQRLFANLQESIEKAYRQSMEKTESLINSEFETMEQARQKQIQDLMQQMGQALASITGRFTEDYSELVSAMDRVVREHDRSRGAA